MCKKKWDNLFTFPKVVIYPIRWRPIDEDSTKYSSLALENISRNRKKNMKHLKNCVIPLNETQLRSDFTAERSFIVHNFFFRTHKYSIDSDTILWGKVEQRKKKSIDFP